MIKKQNSASSRLVFWYMFRNMTKGQRMATDEELLLEILDKLKDAFKEDMPCARKLQAKENNPSILFPMFIEKVKDKAEEYKDTEGYQCLCSVPSFMLALVSVSRIRRHYTHCAWFKISTLQKMLNVHGGVGGICMMLDEMAKDRKSTRLNSSHITISYAV